MEPPQFLSVDDVAALHVDTIAEEGGLGGIRDHGLLDSAVTMPRQRFAGRYLHEDLPAMAAAYLFHITRNHPFHDGNKRTGALTAIVFLDVNHVRLTAPQRDLARAVTAVASGEMTKDELIAWMRGCTSPRE